jgi:hypothetical protein
MSQLMRRRARKSMLASASSGPSMNRRQLAKSKLSSASARKWGTPGGRAGMVAERRRTLGGMAGPRRRRRRRGGGFATAASRITALRQAMRSSPSRRPWQ